MVRFAGGANQAGRMVSSQSAEPSFVSSYVLPERRVASLADDVKNCLLSRPRSLPPKYFYDDRGAWLFEGICSTPEYYPTRAETELLAAYAEPIISAAQPRHMLELGSGSSRKTTYLLDVLQSGVQTATYWPFDVTESMVHNAVSDLVSRYPGLGFHALIGDYTGGLAGVELPDDGMRLALFLGGTIGNFEPADAGHILDDIHGCLRSGDYLLIGFDRIKETPRLEAAYNDAGGYTAAFNKNVLSVLNRELGADFDPQAFSHHAFFNAEAGRIEMHLVADRDVRIRLGALETDFDMAAGESINTEVSYKFSADGIRDLLGRGGFSVEQCLENSTSEYSLVLARAEAPQA